MKILKPSKNKQTGDPKSHGYIAYDFSAKDDLNAYSCFIGKVTQAKNSETRHWLANTDSDPYKPKTGTRKLLTEDYGNYCKIKGEIDGQTYYALYAHLDTGSVLPVGTEVKAGQVIGKIDHTGNSTAPHLHFELRDANGKNIEAEFTTEAETTMEQLPKDNVLRDFYRASKVDFNEDEIKAWLQSNKNVYEVFKSVLEGDGAVKNHLLGVWGVEIDTNKDKWIETQRDFNLSVKEILRKVGLVEGSEIPDILAKMEWLVAEYKKLKEESTPNVIYKIADKEFSKLFSLGNLTLIIEEVK